MKRSARVHFFCDYLYVGEIVVYLRGLAFLGRAGGGRNGFVEAALLGGDGRGQRRGQDTHLLDFSSECVITKLE